ncbi:butyrophilin subfamily 3 member A2-like isoform X1 [Polypterus senegalus]|uniref:butyrophilin subfamily 3 member A2-like isoform X1 n=1 Tax=Polypterus senegalus TaxID=55291 RepID=UPI0019642794|nr:butyrophilin subfamily 3 member A2-like isoform X1 [Polypterus senegalus]XP_039628462.1 butyrophilin subfamily 3 member A2-like isoform X1 [Polypterus senegalus]
MCGGTHRKMKAVKEDGRGQFGVNMEPLILLLQLFCVAAGRDPLQIDPHRVSGLLGKDVRLDCTFDRGRTRADLQIHWDRIERSLYKRVHSYHSGRDDLHDQDADYRGRTSLFPEDFSNGNASLLISNVRVADAGAYSCFVVYPSGPEEHRKELVVLAPYTDPELTYDELLDSLTCNSSGGFPLASLSWTHTSGQDYTSASSTQAHLSPMGVYDIHSTLRGDFKKEDMCCSIFNRDLDETKTHCFGRETPGAGAASPTYFALLGVFCVLMAVTLCATLAVYYRDHLPHSVCVHSWRLRRRITKFSSPVTIKLLGLEFNGIPSLMNSCVWAFKNKGDFQNVAKADMEGAVNGKPLEIKLTEFITLKKEKFLKLTDNNGFEDMQECLNRWNEEAKTEKSVFVFVYRCDRVMSVKLKKEIEQLLMDLTTLSGLYPYVVLTFMNRNGSKALETFSWPESLRVFFVHNYTKDDKKRSSARDLTFLEFLQACIVKAGGAEQQRALMR